MSTIPVHDDGRTDYWAPDSSYDTIAPFQTFTIQDEVVVEIGVNDWLDVDEEAIKPDEIWGF